MKKNTGYIVLLVVLLLPGCGGSLADWGHATFHQSQFQKDESSTIKKYVKQINMYDQLNTVGLYDALWLSDEVRTFYAKKYASMTGKSEEETLTMLRRLFKSNSHNISLYVLSPFDVVLAVKPIEWSLYLEIDGKRYQPTFIKKCELPSQYAALFGKRYNPHKQPYEVKFDRHDANGIDILKHDIPHVMKLFVANPKYIGSTQWDIPVTIENESGLVVQEEQATKEQGVMTEPEKDAKEGDL